MTIDPARTETNPLLDAALDYAAHGWPVLPLRPRDKVPNGLLTPHGLHDATTDTAQITKWWRRVPNANVGIRTGLGLDVIDLDSDAGREALAAVVAEPISPGLLVRTARGWHLWFASSGLASRAGVIEGVDIRGHGGYVVAPPSVHPSGAVYRLVDAGTGALLDRLPPAPLPTVPSSLVAWCRSEGGWAADEVGTADVMHTRPHPIRPNPIRPNPIRLNTEHYVRVAVESECTGVASAPMGTRNQRLNRAAFALGTLVGAELLNGDTARTRLLDAALRAGLDEREAQRTIASGLTAGAQRPRQRPNEPGTTEHRSANKEGRPPDPSRRPDEVATAAVLARARAVSSSVPRAVTPLSPNRGLER